MSIEAIAWAYSVEATPQERNILFSLALYADENHDCWPGISALSSLSCTGRRATIRALNNLEILGLITRTERGKQGKTTTYHLNYSRVSKMTLLGVKNDTQLKYLINLIESYDRVSKMTPLSVKNDTLEESSEPTPFQQLNDKFKNLAHITSERNVPKWTESIRRMLASGVTPDILEQAFGELGDRYTISGPWSVETACSNIMRKKMPKPVKQEVWAEEWGT